MVACPSNSARTLASMQLDARQCWLGQSRRPEPLLVVDDAAGQRSGPWEMLRGRTGAHASSMEAEMADARGRVKQQKSARRVYELLQRGHKVISARIPRPSFTKYILRILDAVIEHEAVTPKVHTSIFSEKK